MRTRAEGSSARRVEEQSETTSFDHEVHPAQPEAIPPCPPFFASGRNAKNAFRSFGEEGVSPRTLGNVCLPKATHGMAQVSSCDVGS